VLEESELIERVLRQDRAACALLVRMHHARLAAVARALVGDGKAEDIVQEAWIAAFAALPKFERRSSLKTWLTRIVLNGARQQLRKDKRMPTVDWDDFSDENLPMAERFDASGHWGKPLVPWTGDTPDDLLDRAELAGCLDSHLQLLPRMQRLTLVLRDQDGLAFAEIAEALETTEANVRVLLHRARLKLLGVIDRFEEVGEC
jgi:RNA polymerase sigma-70 factor (ECF subfamily)